jgi:hypothetical protein
MARSEKSMDGYEDARTALSDEVRRHALHALTDALCAYVEQYGLEHAAGCPEDDTCDCPLVRNLSKALDAAIRAKTG